MLFECTILSFMTFLALQYLSTLSHEWQDFGRTLLHVKCVFLCSLELLSNSFLRIIEGRVVKNVYWSSCKVSVVLVRF